MPKVQEICLRDGLERAAGPLRRRRSSRERGSSGCKSGQDGPRYSGQGSEHAGIHREY